MKKYLFLIMLATIGQTLPAQNLYFPPITGNTWETTSPDSLGWCPEKIDSLLNFLDDNNTRAFLLLKDGKIVLEHYFGTHTQTTPWYWASAGKTLTAFMVGIAQQEGFLSIHDSGSDYLGQGWTSCTPEQEEEITIWHQLTMTSGLDDGVPDPNCLDPECLVYLADAGTRWAYHNPPYTLLDAVIEDATGQTLNAYTNQKLKLFTGMTGNFIMVDNNNVFFSTARSMARFGLLMLNQGNWNGYPVLSDAQYFDAMVNTSQGLNESYGYLWWLNGKASFRIPQTQFLFPGPLMPNAPEDTYAGLGFNGQFVNVTPGENLVWIRMGDAPLNDLVPFLLNDQIWEYLNELECNSVATSESLTLSAGVQVFPNPSNGNFQIVSDQLISRVEVYNIQGQCTATHKVEGKHLNLSTENWVSGMYILQLINKDGSAQVSKIVVNAAH